MDLTEQFEVQRPRLIRIAAGLLDDRAEGEDMVQQAWLRPHDTEALIGNWPAWLTVVTTRLCLDRHRAKIPEPTAPTGSLQPVGTGIAPDPVVGRERAERIVPLLKALADPVRLQLMSMVLSHPGGEACVCDLLPAFELSQPTISHHLKVLHEAGLLERDKRGAWVYYRARSEAMEAVVTLFATGTATA